MKQLALISGKGGTGKTSITAAFIQLAKNAVAVDCDVDASNLHLLISPITSRKNPRAFISGYSASEISENCTGCGACFNSCVFGAISRRETDGKIKINALLCEGCGVCLNICAAGTIKFESKQSGESYISNTRLGVMVHARLFAGEGSSGKLVAEIRKNASDIARDENADYIILDGPPGTGCPVIATLSGTDLAAVIIEPSLSSIHDAGRAIELCRHFKVPTVIIINKHDINAQISEKIEKFAAKSGIEIIGKIPYDEAFTIAMKKRMTVIESDKNSEAAKSIINAWNNFKKSLKF